MKRSELILEYIDGTLDGDAEQQLFDELARQPELRSEMRQFIVIGEAVRADREAFLPPRDLENALMAGLGLAPLPGSSISGAAPVASAPVATGLLAKLGFLKGMLPFMAAFLLGGLLIGGGVYFEMRDDTSSLAAGTSATAPKLRPDSAIEQERVPAITQPVESASDRIASSPISSSPAGASVAPPAAATPSRRSNAPYNSGSRRNGSMGLRSSSIGDGISNTRTAAIPVAVDDTLLNSESESRPALIDNSKLREGSDIGVSTADSINDGNLAPSPVPPIVLPREEESPAPSTITVELRAIPTLLHNENRANLPANMMMTEVFAGGALYRLDDLFQVGIEGGRERFYQTFHYTTVVGDGKRVVRVDQAPLLEWGGVTGRFNFMPVSQSEKWTSFLQLTMGAAPSYGPMMRGRIGLQYDLGTPFGLPLALAGSAEGAALLYFRGSESMASTNAGLSFGVEVGL